MKVKSLISIMVAVTIIVLLIVILVKVFQTFAGEDNVGSDPDKPEFLFFLRATGSGEDESKPYLFWDTDEDHPYDFQITMKRDSPSETVMFADIPEHFAFGMGDIYSLSVIFSADQDHTLDNFKKSKGYEVAHPDAQYGFNVIADQLGNATEPFYKKNPNCSITLVDSDGVIHTVIAMLVDINREGVNPTSDEDMNDIFNYRFRLLYPVYNIADFPKDGYYDITVTFDSFWSTLGLVSAAVGVVTTCSVAGAFTFGLAGVACAGAVGGYVSAAGIVITNGDDDLFVF